MVNCQYNPHVENPSYSNKRPRAWIEALIPFWLTYHVDSAITEAPGGNVQPQLNVGTFPPTYTHLP